jgi:putative transposase
MHLIIIVPPKVSISELMGRLKGRSAIRILKNYPTLRKKRYWGNHFWAPDYCVDTVGLDAEMIRRYVRYQEQYEKKVEQQQLKFQPCEQRSGRALWGLLATPLWGAPSFGLEFLHS